MPITREDIIATLGDLSPEARVRALRQALAEVESENARHRYKTPGELAVALDPNTVQTPALEAIDEALVEAVETGGRLIITVPPQEGKGTPLDSVVWVPMSTHTDTTTQTTTGFKKMRDIKPGDYVIHPSGHPVKVIWKSPVWTDRETYKVELSDGRSTIVDGQHTWTVYDLKKQTRINGKSVRGATSYDLTTDQIIESGLYREKPRARPSGTTAYAYRWALPEQQAIITPDIPGLIIPPYALGLWLADGDASNNYITEGIEDTPELVNHLTESGAVVNGVNTITRDNGYKHTRIKVATGNAIPWTTALKQLGVHNNKHIPDMYLTAGTNQRLELLRGLVDGDGSISTNGTTFRVEYSTCIPELAEGVATIVRSLGWRTTIKCSASSLNGVRKKDRYRVCFTPTTGDPFNPFHLTRKASRVQDNKSRGKERSRVTITNITPMGVQDTVCIQVDSPDGLYLTGRQIIPTHNSTRVGVWLPVWALMRNPDARVVVASYAESLAARNAYQARAIVAEHGSGAVDEVTGEALPDSLGFTVAKDNRQKRSWGVQGASGGYYATGTGGGLTGRAADCVHGDTGIITEYGNTTAREAYERGDQWILSYNHEKRCAEWRRVEARRRIPGRRMVTVETEAGNVLTCTPDHLVYAGGRYTPAGSLRGGEEVILAGGGYEMPAMRAGVRGIGRGGAEVNKTRAGATMHRPVLYQVEGGEGADEVLRSVQRPGAEVKVKDVQRPLFGGGTRAEGYLCELPVVWEENTGEEFPYAVLRPGMRGAGAFGTDDGEGEQPPHSIHITEGGVQPATPVDYGTGWEPMCRVRGEGKFARASQERGLGGQPTGEPGDRVQLPPFIPPSRQGTVAGVTPGGVADAYDFQVEGNHNFFADGVLVHNCLIIDDPLKNQQQADSARERQKVWEWWTTVAQTRLAPGAAVVIIMTRWHPEDLVGEILAEEAKLPATDRVWRVLNIPAIAEEGVPDALGREPGVALESARGRTKEEFERIRRAVGPRAWAALYQGQPEPSEGGLFARDEFEAGRVASADLVGRVVSVDPAESGVGDEAGLLLMGWDADGVVYVEEDLSRPMASATWARESVRLAVRSGAAAVVYEAFTTERTYRDVLESAWREIAYQARLLRECGGDTVAAAERWHMEGQPGDTLTPMQRTLEILDMMPETDHMPFRLVPWRKRGDKVARAAGARQSVTIGRLRMIGTHAVLERQGVSWQPGEGSPDRVDAMVNGHDFILGEMGRPAEISFPGDW